MIAAFSEHVHALRSCERGCFLVVQTLWAEKIRSTTDARSLNTLGRNEIEVAPISSALLSIACLVILYKTCSDQDSQPINPVSAISAKLGLPHETDARHRTFTVQTAVSAPSTTRCSQACREAAKALDEAAKMLDEAASLNEQTMRVKKDRGDVRCRDIETFS